MAGVMPWDCERQNEMSDEPKELRPGLLYGGRGPGGEYYSKDTGRDYGDVWVRESDRQVWTAEDFEAIAAHMRKRGTANEGLMFEQTQRILSRIDKGAAERDAAQLAEARARLRK